MKYSDNIKDLAKALSGLQGEIKDAEKDNQGHGYKYADLGQVLSLIRPLLPKHGLAFTQHVGNADDKILIETMVMHESGQWISSEIAMPPVAGTKYMSAPQAVGSVITYGRRYALTAIFGITQVAEDNDAPPAQRYETKNQAARPPLSPVAESSKPAIETEGFVIALKSAFGAKDSLTAWGIWGEAAEDVKRAVWKHLDADVHEWLKKLKSNPPKAGMRSDVSEGI